jgi:hypothetical protein
MSSRVVSNTHGSECCKTLVKRFDENIRILQQ